MYSMQAGRSTLYGYIRRFNIVHHSVDSFMLVNQGTWELLSDLDRNDFFKSPVSPILKLETILLDRMGGLIYKYKHLIAVVIINE